MTNPEDALEAMGGIESLERDLSNERIALALEQEILRRYDLVLTNYQPMQTKIEEQITTFRQNLQAAQTVKQQIAADPNVRRQLPVAKSLIQTIQRSLSTAEKRRSDIARQVLADTEARADMAHLVSEHQAAVTDLETNINALRRHLPDSTAETS